MARRATAAFATLLVGLALAGPATAATFTVTGFGDVSDPPPCNSVSGQCDSIRAAVFAAANTVEDDSIVLAPGTYTLSAGVIPLNTNLAMVGTGARETVVRQTGSNQVFTVTGGAKVTLAGMTIRDGNNAQGSGGNLSVASGATLSLGLVRVTNGTAARGGGVANSGTLTVTGSLIDGNVAQAGGGGIFDNAADSLVQTTVAISTLAGNVAPTGGAILSQGLPQASLQLFQATIARNTGGGLAFANSQNASAIGSLIADNAGPNCQGLTLSGSQNVFKTAECGSAGIVADPLVAAALSDQGGDTDVLTIPATSPAIDVVNPCPSAVDQRGEARVGPAGGACDAGAYELSAAGGPAPTPTPTAAVPTPTATPIATPTPTPVANKTVVTREVEGTVKVKVPGSNRFVDLNATQGFPVGSTIDTKKGKVEITAQTKPGAPPQKATFYDGIFKLTQKSGITTLTLVEQLAPCSKKARAAAGKKPASRKLWGDGKGNFRTQGRYSAATIRGTIWLVSDTCAGTKTTVKQGVVVVRDDVLKKNITLRAPKSYLARPRK